MSNNVKQCQTSCQTVTEYVCIVILIHKYYVTDMTAKQCQTMSDKLSNSYRICLYSLFWYINIMLLIWLLNNVRQCQTSCQTVTEHISIVYFDT